MLSEGFLDTCITALCSLDSNKRITKEIVDSVHKILFLESKDSKTDYDIEFSIKHDLLKYVCDYRQANPQFDLDTMLQGISNGIFKDQVEYLRNKKIEITEDREENIKKMIFDKRKFFELVALGTRRIQDAIDKISAGSYKDDSEASSEWMAIVNDLYLKSLEIRKLESIDNIASLDLMEDSYESIMDKLRENSSKKDTVKTGFNILKTYLPSDGFEQGRLYLIGGTSGVGKSVFLANLIANAVSDDSFVQEKNSKTNTYLYITAENLLDESLERLYCILTQRPVSEVKASYFDPTFNMADEIKSILKKNNANIIMKYVHPKKTTTLDIEMMIDAVKSSGYNLKCVYLDYLDLIRSGRNLLDLRHELGEVTISLKNIAVSYRIPLITVTQLNRAGYDKEQEANLVQMSESMQKIDNSDSVFFLQNDKEPVIALPCENGMIKNYKNIKFSILKNRNGAIYKNCNFIMQESVSNISVFNFKMEEKPSFTDPLDIEEAPAKTTTLSNINGSFSQF